MARVLIIERDPDLGEWLGETLNRFGHQALMATNGTEGMDLVDSVAPDLIVTSVALPEMDRLEDFHKLYDRLGPRIISISEEAPPGTALETADCLAASSTLHKPFTETELIDKVETVLASQ